MTKKNSVLIRADSRMGDEIREIQLRRQNLFKRERLKPKSQRRITLAMTRHPEFRRIKKDIIKDELR